MVKFELSLINVSNILTIPFLVLITKVSGAYQTCTPSSGKRRFKPYLNTWWWDVNLIDPERSLLNNLNNILRH